jgi:D-alanyl-D-alanine carboxypeptidase (penicillin-binding protein 5/6)
MTALLTLEKLPLSKRVPAARYSATPGESQIGLRAGERLSARDLLKALLLESANDAAVTLAVGIAGSSHGFVYEMNQRAQALRLEGTHYANPIGLDDSRNYSTATDLSLLTRRLMGNRTFERTVNSRRARLETGSKPRVVHNRNDLIGRVRWIDGVKTGHTEKARYVLVGSGTRKKVRLVSVVLGEPSQSARDSDTLKLLNYGFRFYRREWPVRAGRIAATARVAGRGGTLVGLVAARTAAVTLRGRERARVEVDAPATVEGPLAKGARVGTIAVYHRGKRARVVPLVTGEKVAGPTLVGNLLRALAVMAVALCLILVAIERRRRRKIRLEVERRRRRAARESP